MRMPMVVGNWKMHGTCAEARALARSVREGVDGARGVEVAVCPPFTALGVVGEILHGSPVALGAQDCHWERQGAFTGAISPAMLVETRCRVVLVGHSERRHLFRETDDEIEKKVAACVAHGLQPVLCVGETAEQRRQGLTFTVVDAQVRAAWGRRTPAEVGRCLLAYEPVWAIGTGHNATPAQAADVHGHLRGLVRGLAGVEVAQGLRILYGGSVKPDNAAELGEAADIDGVLVGGASLDATAFISIVNSTSAPGGPARG